MSFSQTILDAIDRLKNKYNSNAYDATTNPGGLASDGHQLNFPAALQDTSDVAAAVGDAADTAAANASDVSTMKDDVATLHGQVSGFKDDAETAATASGTARDKSEKWAEEVEDAEVEPGKYSAKHHAAKAGQDASDVSTMKDDVTTLHGQASGFKDDAETAATASGTARDKSEKWAEEVEDAEVEPGKYSAKHHAAKAGQDASDVSTMKDDVTTLHGQASGFKDDAETAAQTSATKAGEASDSADAAAASASSIDLTTDEIAQLKNIGDVTISYVQWGYLGALDQGLAKGNTPEFAGLSLTAAISVGTSVARVTPGDGYISRVYGSPDALYALNSTATGKAGFHFGDSGGDKRGWIEYANDAEALAVGTNGSERIAITNIGRVGIGVAAPATNLDVQSGSASVVARVRTTSGSHAASFDIITDDTANSCYLNFGDFDDENIGRIRYNHNVDSMYFRTNAADQLEIQSTGLVRPGVDGAQDLGSATRRWDTIFATNSTINTSDANEKSVRGSLSAAELAAWAHVNMEVFQWLSAVADKGEDKARLHTGLVAQKVEAAFEAEGLDPGRYALFCKDEIIKTVLTPRTKIVEKTELKTVETQSVKLIDGTATLVFDTSEVETVVVEEHLLFDEGGAPMMTDPDDGSEPVQLTVKVPVMVEVADEPDIEEVPTGEYRYGLRPTECLFFEAAYQRACHVELAERVAALEGTL